jgi:Domain of unknown function (DUF4872)/Butirosin biosynthesis protein H, N-terminal
MPEFALSALDLPTPIEFDHVHAAHCESGSFAALLRHDGLKLSEAMVFGIGSGLFFLYLPFLKIYDLPLIAYRDMPNAIIARVARRLGVKVVRTRYRDPERGMQALDRMLAAGQPVGMQTGVFWLPYFPRDMRFQFNGHHVIAYGREDHDYLLSDTVFEEVVRCPAEDLRRARFSKGPLAPRGLLYHIESRSQQPDIERAVRAGLRTTASRMLNIPLPWMGVAGIRALAGALARWPLRLSDQAARSHLANVIRMQEEIGTGGAGFRFMYAAFLDEASAILGRPALQEASAMLSNIGDRWREFAVQGAQVIRGGNGKGTASPAAYKSLSGILLECASREQEVFRAIRAAL